MTETVIVLKLVRSYKTEQLPKLTVVQKIGSELPAQQPLSLLKDITYLIACWTRTLESRYHIRISDLDIVKKIAPDTIKVFN